MVYCDACDGNGCTECDEGEVDCPVCDGNGDTEADDDDD